jgi:excisionase family DNA binding protein
MMRSVSTARPVNPGGPFSWGMKVKFDKDYLTVREAAEVLGYSPATIRALCKNRPGFAYQLNAGGDWRVHADAVISLKSVPHGNRRLELSAATA